MTDSFYPLKKMSVVCMHLITTLTALVLFLIAGASAATAQQIQEISFQGAVDIAMQNSIAIRRGANNLQAQEYSVRSAKANFLPNLNANSGGARNMGLTNDPTTNRLSSIANNSFNIGITTNLNLFNGFRDVATLEQAQLVLSSLQFDYERTRQTVVFNVITNFLIVIRAEEDIKIRQDDVEAQQTLLNQIREFVNAGSRAISDQYTQEATLASSESSLLASENSFSNAKTRLIQVLQIDPLVDYHFTSPDPESIDLSPIPYVENDLIRSAYESRSDLRAQEDAIEAAWQAVRIARGGYYPTLNFSAGASTAWTSLSRRLSSEVDDEGIPIFEDIPFRDQIEDNRSGRFSLSLNVPIFNRLNTKTSVQRSRIAHSNEILALEELQQSVALDVRQAYNNYQTALKALNVTETGLRSATQALQVEQERYDVGASTLVDLTISQARFTQSSSQRIQALFDFYFQQRLIEYYEGTLYPAGTLFE